MRTLKIILFLLIATTLTVYSKEQAKQFENNGFSFSYPDFMTVVASTDGDSLKTVTLKSDAFDRVDVNFIIPEKRMKWGKCADLYIGSLVGLLYYGGGFQGLAANDFNDDAREVKFGDKAGRGSYYTVTVGSTKVYGRIVVADNDNHGIVAIDINTKDSMMLEKLEEIQNTLQCKKLPELASKQPKTNAPAPIQTKPSASKEKIYDVVEQMPSFEGSTDSLVKYLYDNIKYPAEAEEKEVQGKVVVGFVVEKDGSITDLKVLRSADSLLNAEAIRVVAAMPKWNPGMQGGKALRVRYTLPVPFKLPSDDQRPTPPAILSMTLKNLQSLDEVANGVIVDNPATSATFVGGDEALNDYIAQNTEYPQAFRDMGIEDHVVIKFIVEKDGSLSHVTLAEGNSKSLCNSAMKMVEGMPKWQPAKNGDVVVRSRNSVTVEFKK